jgi:RHS repeat-associated protein
MPVEAFLPIRNGDYHQTQQEAYAHCVATSDPHLTCLLQQFFGYSYVYVSSTDLNVDPIYLTDHFFPNPPCPLGQIYVADPAIYTNGGNQPGICKASASESPADIEKTKGQPENCVGNPCDPATGNKFQREEDYRSGDSRLLFSRWYNSQGQKDLGLGMGWTHNFSGGIEVDWGGMGQWSCIVALISTPPTSVVVRRPDGKGLKYFCEVPIAGPCTNCTLPKGGVGEAYKLKLYPNNLGEFSEVTGIKGTVPPGLTIDFDRYVTGDSKRPHNLVLRGTPTKAGIYQFSYKFEDKTVWEPIEYIPGYGNYITQTIEVTDTNGTYGVSLCSHDVDNKLKLSQEICGFVLTLPDGTRENYRLSGQLLNTIDKNANVINYDYRTDGKLGGVTDPFGRALTFDYDASGRLSTVSDAAGQLTSYSYNANNNLIKVTYHDGSAKIYHYENVSFPHHLTGISYVSNTGTTSFSYFNSISNLKRFSTYAYDAQGRVVISKHEAPRTLLDIALNRPALSLEEVNLTYDSATTTTVNKLFGTQDVMTFQTNAGVKNLVSKVTQNDGGKSLVQAFDANNNLTCRKDEEGRVTTYTYNTSNQRISMMEGQSGDCVNPASTAVTRLTTYQYLAPDLDFVTVVESPSVYAGVKKRTEINYDNNHNPITITRRGYTPAGAATARTVTLGYNGFGQVTSIDGPRTDVSDIETFTYFECTTGGACGQLKSATDALGHTTTFGSYTPDGRVSQMTDPNGLKTTYTYFRGRLASLTVTPPGGTSHITQNTYDNVLNVTKTVFPDGRTLNYTYDFAQYLRSVVDNLGNNIGYTYDRKGNLIAQLTRDPTGALARSIQTSYDIRNHVSSIYRDGSVTKLVHDAIGNLVSRTDPNQSASLTPLSTTYQYDALNQLFATQDPPGGIMQYTYDVNGNLRLVQAPNSATTGYTVDDLGNVLSETSPDRGVVNNTYDAAGNMLTATDARGITVSYTYDALNRLLKMDYPGTEEDVTYTHDLGTGCTDGLGRLCQVTEGQGSTAYGYDAFGNIVTQTRTEGTTTYTTSYAYDLGNRIVSTTYPDGRSVSYTRDAIGRISTVSTTVNGSSVTLTSNRGYRADGLLTAQTLGNTLTETRSYDLQGRLTNQVLGTVDNRTYTYDANGNPTVTAFGNFSYDVLDRLIQETLATSSQSFTYDPNSNRTADGSGTYGYITASNRLNSAPSGSVNLDASGNTTMDLGGTRSFTYNNAGRLSQVTIGSISTTYAYNAFNQRIRKTTPSNTTIYHYDITGNLILETNPDGRLIREYIYTDDILLAKIEAGTTTETLTYLHNDHLNTPRLATNQQGIKVWSWDSDGFGKSLPNEDPDNDGSLTTVNLRFPGQYFDQESGLHYNWNRYYDPRTGRYITSDPIGLRGGLNTYAYVNNGPLRFIDLLGLDWQYSQSTGQLTYINNQTEASKQVGIGYSGNGPGLNNPDMQNVLNIGPIPAGTYKIGPQQDYIRNDGTTLYGAMTLTPQTGTNTFGRAGFLFHGDNDTGNQTASEGCPVLSRPIRNQIGNSGDPILRVVR